MPCKTEKLQFSKGTTVEANVGTFQKGKIVNHWDEGNAYRIELDNSDKVNGKYGPFVVVVVVVVVVDVDVVVLPYKYI